jgi:histidine phosphotransferase ChpT
MTGDMVDLLIVELLAARLCHEMVGPIGAISNGLEILDDEPDFASDAGALIAQSAQQAACRLQFYRIAYGSTGAIADALARAAAAELFAHGKIRCRWAEMALPVGWEKLACNLLLLASEALPRGGEIRLDTDGRGITVTAAGDGIRLTGLEPALLDGTADLDDLSPRTVQTAFTAHLARRLGAGLSLRESSAEQMVLAVQPLS